METRAPFKPPRFVHFDYIDADRAVVLHEILTDMMTDELLQVIGHPEEGNYEWVVLNKTRIIAHSNRGYGMPRAAMRDGLLAALGYPNEPIEEISTAHNCDATAKPKVYPPREERTPTHRATKSRRRP